MSSSIYCVIVSPSLKTLLGSEGHITNLWVVLTSEGLHTCVGPETSNTFIMT